MVDGLFICCVIIDNGKGGRGDNVIDAQLLAQRLDEGGLAGTHLAVEGKHVALTHLADELTGRLTYRI